MKKIIFLSICSLFNTACLPYQITILPHQPSYPNYYDSPMPMGYSASRYDDGLGYIIRSTSAGDFVSGPNGYFGKGHWAGNNYYYNSWQNY